MKIFVSGGAGFIGSHLVDALVDKGHEVVVYDNLSSGKKDCIEQHIGKKGFKFVKGDLLNLRKTKKAMKGCELVYHMAANPDIRYGIEHTDTDLKQNTVATYNVLEAMRLNGIKSIVFASTSAVYGETEQIPTPEDCAPMIPISLYGASKLACESLISAFCFTFGFKAWIFRFANIVGERSTHGVILDFIKKLEKNRKELEILGDGEQEKSYLEVKELVEGMLHGVESSDEQLSIFNIGSNDALKVRKIAEMLVEEMGLKGVKFRFTGGSRGWKGDVPKMLLDNSRINNAGWKPKLNSEKAVRSCIKNLLSK